MIDIPKDLLITECNDPTESIVSEVYGNTFEDSKDPIFFQERAILCPTNEDVDIINNYMLDHSTGIPKSFFCSKFFRACTHQEMSIYYSAPLCYVLRFPCRR